MTITTLKDVFLTALALATIPLLLVPYLVELSSATELAVFGADVFIWAAFATDLAVSTYRSPNRLTHLKQHWLDVLIVLLPFLRPLRAARVLRAVRVAVFLARILNGIRGVMGQPGFGLTLAIGAVLLVGLALVMTVVESGSAGAIDGPGDAIWWAFVTATTVGYGDAFPVTGLGRVLGIATMFVGISLFGAVTAFITSFLVRGEDDEATARLNQIDEKLDRIQHMLSRG